MIKIFLNGQHLDISSPTIISESLDYLTASVYPKTDDWKNAAIVVHFSRGSVHYELLVNDNQITKDQHLNLTEGTWEVYCHGNFGNSRITTNVVKLIVKSTGCMKDGSPMPDVPPSIAEQILDKAQNAENLAQSVRDDANSGKFDGKDGVDGKDGIDGKNGINGNDGKDGVNGQNGKNGVDGKDGAIGPPGPEGPPGPQGPPGKDTLTPRGSFKPSAIYYKNDIVYYNGDGYLVKREVTGITPSESDEYYYMQLVGHGANGKNGKDGAIGPPGPEGPPGPQGPPGPSSESGVVKVVTVTSSPLGGYMTQGEDADSIRNWVDSGKIAELHHADKIYRYSEFAAGSAWFEKMYVESNELKYTKIEVRYDKKVVPKTLTFALSPIV